MIEHYVETELRPAGIECIALDTGLDTPTGGRVAMAAGMVASEPFCLTYVDGLADIDLSMQGQFHESHGSLATVTTVRPNLQWGVARIDDHDRVEAFVEKPRMDEWVNGGFFWLEPEALEFIEEGSVLEEAPLAGLASAGQLMAFRHEGFWDCVDTYKDLIAVNDLWNEGKAPWLPSW